MDDLISRQAVVDSVNKALSEYMGESLLTYSSLILDYIKALPSVQPKQKMGRWIFHKPFDNGHKNCNECIECSQCHTWLGHDCYAKTPYCPICGAKMESEDKK